MNTLTLALIASVFGLACLVVGWIFGRHVNQATRGAARVEGRAESSIELARAQEKIVFLEERVRHELERASALEQQALQSQGRAQRAETECAQLRERLVGLTDVEKAREQAASIARRDSAELTTQREKVISLTAQFDGANITRQQLQERVAELSKVEHDLRSELTGRDGELVIQREAVSGLRAQWRLLALAVFKQTIALQNSPELSARCANS